MLKNIFYTLFLIASIFTNTLKADNDYFRSGARSAGMGNASIVHADIWSNFQNQAGLAYLNNFEVGVYHENKYGVKELAVNSIALALPTSTGTIGINYSYYGYSNYNESKIGLAFGKKFAETFAAGVQVDYYNRFLAAEYGRRGDIAVEAGIIATPFENFYIGAHAFNPAFTVRSNGTEERLQSVFRLGAGYNFGDILLLVAEAEKDVHNKAVLKAGFEYEIVENLKARAGIANNPNLFAFGFGYFFKGFSADIAFSKHYILGFTPHLALTYRIVRDNE